MSTIIIALLITISSITIPLIFILIARKKSKKRYEKFLNLFSQEGSKQELSFSSQELLKSRIIGLDGLRQTLLVFDFENAGNIICIAMAEVKNCMAEKKYDSIVIGTERKAIIEPHLRNIDLKFSFKNNAEPVSVSFYDSNVNSIYEMAELETKVKTWEAVLSKMIFKEEKIRV
ncbi:MAG: hypothetical protein ABI863_13860 [Ginsengibacter sp.]